MKNRVRELEAALADAESTISEHKKLTDSANKSRDALATCVSELEQQNTNLTNLLQSTRASLRDAQAHVTKHSERRLRNEKAKINEAQARQQALVEKEKRVMEN